MKKKITVFAASILCAAALAIAANPSVDFNVSPKLNCHKCEMKIKKNLRFEKGIKKINVDIPANTVTVEYDSTKTTPAKISEALQKIGYDSTKK